MFRLGKKKWHKKYLFCKTSVTYLSRIRIRIRSDPVFFESPGSGSVFGKPDPQIRIRKKWTGSATLESRTKSRSWPGKRTRSGNTLNTGFMYKYFQGRLSILFLKIIFLQFSGSFNLQNQFPLFNIVNCNCQNTRYPAFNPLLL